MERATARSILAEEALVLVEEAAQGRLATGRIPVLDAKIAELAWDRRRIAMSRLDRAKRAPNDGRIARSADAAATRFEALRSASERIHAVAGSLEGGIRALASVAEEIRSAIAAEAALAGRLSGRDGQARRPEKAEAARAAAEEMLVERSERSREIARHAAAQRDLTEEMLALVDEAAQERLPTEKIPVLAEKIGILAANRRRIASDRMERAKRAPNNGRIAKGAKAAMTRFEALRSASERIRAVAGSPKEGKGALAAVAEEIRSTIAAEARKARTRAKGAQTRAMTTAHGPAPDDGAPRTTPPRETPEETEATARRILDMAIRVRMDGATDRRTLAEEALALVDTTAKGSAPAERIPVLAEKIEEMAGRRSRIAESRTLRAKKAPEDEECAKAAQEEANQAEALRASAEKIRALTGSSPSGTVQALAEEIREPLEKELALARGAEDEVIATAAKARENAEKATARRILDAAIRVGMDNATGRRVLADEALDLVDEMARGSTPTEKIHALAEKIADMAGHRTKMATRRFLRAKGAPEGEERAKAAQEEVVRAEALWTAVEKIRAVKGSSPSGRIQALAEEIRGALENESDLARGAESGSASLVLKRAALAEVDA